MAEPTTAAGRRRGLRRARAAAAGASVGAAVLLTGGIALVHPAPAAPGDPAADRAAPDGPDAIGADEFEPARPFTPQASTPTTAPSDRPAPPTRIRSGGS